MYMFVVYWTDSFRFAVLGIAFFAWVADKLCWG